MRERERKRDDKRMKGGISTRQNTVVAGVIAREKRSKTFLQKTFFYFLISRRNKVSISTFLFDFGFFVLEARIPFLRKFLRIPRGGGRSVNFRC